MGKTDTEIGQTVEVDIMIDHKGLSAKTDTLTGQAVEVDTMTADNDLLAETDPIILEIGLLTEIDPDLLTVVNLEVDTIGASQETEMKCTNMNLAIGKILKPDTAKAHIQKWSVLTHHMSPVTRNDYPER